MGPPDSCVIDTFIFDKKGLGSKYEYEPDVVYLNCKIKENSKKELKGLIHSHPPGYPELSDLDLDFVKEVFDASPDLKGFWMGLVIDPPCKDDLLVGKNFLCYCVCRNMKISESSVLIL